MSRLCLLVSALACLLVSSSAMARPNWGRDCWICHAVSLPPNPNAPDVVGYDTWADPDESGTGAPDRGLLQTYTVAPGDSIDLQVLVDFLLPEGTVKFSVALERMEATGVESGGTLVYSADPDWFYQEGIMVPDPLRPYYTATLDTGMLYLAPQTFTFTMSVDAATSPDYYDLEFALAGLQDTTRFYSDEHFYLHVIPEPTSLTLVATAMVVLFSRRRRPACGP